MFFHGRRELPETLFYGKDRKPIQKKKKNRADHFKCLRQQCKEMIALSDNLTDEASISATPSHPFPPPCNRSQYRTASFTSSKTFEIKTISHFLGFIYRVLEVIH